jgi:hypothetical protein
LLRHWAVDKLRARVGAPFAALFALLLALPLLVSRPADAFASQGPTAVGCVEGTDIALQQPRRATTSLDRDLRGFAVGFVGELPETWCLPLRSAALAATEAMRAPPVRDPAIGPPHVRGPPTR